MYSIESQTIFYEYQNKNHKIIQVLLAKFIYYMRIKTTYRVAKQYHQNHPFNLQPNQLKQINLGCNLYKENHCTN